jgi:hypothetical protein
MVTQHPIHTPIVSRMSRLSPPMLWAFRCICVILAVLGTWMLPYAVSAQPQDFEIFAEPNSAGPGDPVKVSFHSLDPRGQPITYCAANFEGSPSEDCSSLTGEWGSVTIYVPNDAVPVKTVINTRLRYQTPDGGVGYEKNIPFEITSRETVGPQDFEISAEPTRAGLGDAVEVSFHALKPEAGWITSCKAHFEGNPSENCDSVEDEWNSITLYVPKDANRDTILIRASLTYETEYRTVGDSNAILTIKILAPLQPPPDTSRPSSNTGGTPRSRGGGAHPTAATPLATRSPQNIPAEPTGSWPAILVLLALLVILPAVIIALLRRYGRRNSAGHEQVQARARSTLGPIIRIEETSKRPPWTIRLNPSRGDAKEQIEEVRR